MLSDIAEKSSSLDSVDPSVLAHIVDVHCHPVETPYDDQTMDDLPIHICAMATTALDQQKVATLTKKWPDKVTPAFGYHPWFSHTIALTPPTSKEAHYRSLFLSSSSGPVRPEHEEAFGRLVALLPVPHLLSDLLHDLRFNLETHPNAMLGEVGIDRAARVPFPLSQPPSPRSCCTPEDSSADPITYRRELSPFITPLPHQLSILEAQISLAIQLHRNVSIHSVKAPQPTRDFLDRMAHNHGEEWLRISVDMHSCGMSPQVWTEIEKHNPNVFLSLSTAINGRSPNHIALIKSCSPTRLLIESDYGDAKYLASQTWDILLTVSRERCWRIEQSWDEYADADPDANADDGERADSKRGEEKMKDGFPESWGAVRRLEANWRRFMKGRHKKIIKPNRKDSKWDDWDDEE